MRVSGACARETTVPGLAVAVHLVITNDSNVDDAHVRASSPAAATVDLHQTTTGADGMLAVGPVDAIPVPAGRPAVLEPGGHHMMLVDPYRPLSTGDVAELTPTFVEAQPHTASASVPALVPRRRDTYTREDAARPAPSAR